MKRIVTIIGTRPQSIKAAVVARVLHEEHADAIEERILYTGQHYDRELFEVFFEEMGIPVPFRNLGVGSGEQGAATAAMISGIESSLREEDPDLVLLYGDTNTTLAGSIAASKLHIPIAHVEAGLRSYRKRMPEEINRVLTDHVSTFLFTPTRTGSQNLFEEGFPPEAPERPSIDEPLVFRSGDVMYDSILHFGPIAERRSDVLERLGIEGPVTLVTCHRAENTDDPEKLRGVMEGILQLSRSSERTTVIPLHPRTRKAIEEGIDPGFREKFEAEERIRICEPLSYFDMLRLQRNASLILTDSGGLQKEAFFQGVPCLLFREESEWKESLENGGSRLVGTEPERLLKAWKELDEDGKGSVQDPELFGDGNAGRYICRTLRNFWEL